MKEERNKEIYYLFTYCYPMVTRIQENLLNNRRLNPNKKLLPQRFGGAILQ